jgi:hypothetical protein
VNSLEYITEMRLNGELKPQEKGLHVPIVSIKEVSACCSASPIKRKGIIFGSMST